MKVAVIGGGAAGFFAAIHAKINYPEAAVTIFEKSTKVLAKVKVSGGGRCNVTNGCTSIATLAKAYPRGGKQLKKAFRQFNTVHTMQWFERRGVPLVIQEDQCVFPKSQDSQTIIDCLVGETQKLGISISTKAGVQYIVPIEGGLKLTFLKETLPAQTFDKVIVATGGSPKESGLAWLAKLNHEIATPVPSLFTFNMPKEPVTELMGIVVDPVFASIQGTKLKAEGPLLITHWGMSGPAILKLSAFGARILQELDYAFTVQINWVHIQDHQEAGQALQAIINENSDKQLVNYRPFNLPKRLWYFLLQKMALSNTKKMGRIGQKRIPQTITHLTQRRIPSARQNDFQRRVCYLRWC